MVRVWNVAAVALFLCIIGALYTTRLGDAPMHLMHDEVNFGLQAYSVASTGRDTNGRRFPLYFSETGFEAGRDPVMIYVTALFLTWRPLADASIRMPTAIVGVLSVVLMFLLGRTIFRSARLGLTGASLLALTPGLFINSRLALSIAYPIPFILGWLLALARFDARRTRSSIVAASVMLGLGVYSYLACLVMMPLYLLCTVRFLVERRHIRARWVAVATFAAMLVPLVVWQVMYPGRYGGLVNAYRPYDAQSLGLSRGALSMLHDVNWRQGISAFWMFFNPDFLFISGGSRMTNSTRHVGLFPLACAVFIPMGIYAVLKAKDVFGRVVLIGFLTAPLATALSGRLDINRVLCGIPFGALTAMYGVEYLMAQPGRLARAVAAALLIAVPLQFVSFYADYMGPYRVASTVYFGRDERGAVREVLRTADTGTTVYLNRATPIERYWRFYALADGRGDLVDAPVYYDPQTFAGNDASGRSVVVCDSGQRLCESLGASPGWRRVKVCREPSGAPMLEVYQRP